MPSSITNNGATPPDFTPPRGSPTSQEENPKASLLRTLDLPPPPSIKEESLEKFKLEGEEISLLRVGVNFLADGLLTGGSGEQAQDGLMSAAAYKIWQWLLESYTKDLKDPYDKQVAEGFLTQVKQANEYLADLEELDKIENHHKGKLLSKTALKHANLVLSLKIGESSIFPTGWANRGTGGTNHALVVEICKTSDKVYDLKIYTPGPLFTAQTTLAGDKVRQQPMVCYRNIPEAILFFNRYSVHPGVIQALIEITAISRWDSSRTVDMEQFQQIFDYLEEYRIKEDSSRYGLITSQQGGTCVPSSAKAWLREASPSLEFYKSMIFDLDFRLLIGLFRAFESNWLTKTSTQADMCRRLLEQAARKLMRKAIKLTHNDPHFKTSKLNAIKATCEDILEKLEQVEADLAKKAKANTLPTNFLELDIKKQQNSRSQVSFRTTIPTPSTKINASTLPILYDKQTPPQDLLKELKSVYQRYPTSSVDVNTVECKHLEIHSLIDSLPLPVVKNDLISERWLDRLEIPKYWEQFKDPDKIRAVIDALYDVEERYSTSMQRDYPSRCLATLFSFQVLIHFLSVRIEAFENKLTNEARLESYGLPDLTGSLNEIDGLFFFKRDEYTRIESIKNYITEYNNAKKVLFNIDNNESEYISTYTRNIIKYSIGRSPVDGFYLSQLIACDKDLQDAVDKVGAERFPDLTQEAIRKDYEDQKAKHDQYLKEVARRNDYLFPVLQPQEKVNLAPETKRSLLLYELHPQSFLDKNQTYRYLNIRRYNLGHIYQALRKSPPQNFFDEQMTIKTSRSSPYGYGGLAQVNRLVTNEIDREIAVKHSSPSLGEYSKERIKYDRRLKRFDVNLNKQTIEAFTLGERVSADESLYARMLRVLTEWQLTPHQLIYETKQDLSYFASRDSQELFKHLFFRTIVNANGSVELGTGNLLLQDPSLLENALEFIQKGNNYFYDQKRNVQGVRFFFELAYYIGQYLIDGGKKADRCCQVQSINHWLLNTHLSNIERSVLHLYRILFYSLKPIDSLTEENLIEIYTSWLHFNLYPELDHNRSPLAFEAARDFILTLTKKADRNLLDKTLPSKVLENLKISDHQISGPWGWDAQFGFPLLSKGRVADFIKIDLALGKIYSNTGCYAAVSAQPHWEQSDSFKRLFKNEKNFSYFSTGEKTIAFRHPALGMIRMILRNSDDQEPFILRKFKDSDEWYRYIPIRIVQSTGVLPQALAYDHAFWEPLNPNSHKGIVTDLQTHEIKYYLEKSGQIVSEDKQLYINFLDANNCDGFFQFDDRYNILCLSDAKNNVINQLIYPRYTSQWGGDPLTFIHDEKIRGRLLWKEHRGYYLSNPTPGNVLGKIPNYLYLRPVNGKGPAKVLVPLQELDIGSDPGLNATLKINNFKPLKTENGINTRSEQAGIFQYFVFNYDKETLTATTLEGTLFQAYLYLGQKRYVDAIALLKQLKPTDRLSPLCNQILKLIEDLDKAEGHPERLLVHFHALILRMKEVDRLTKSPVKVYFTNRGDCSQTLLVFQDFANYLDRMSNAAMAARLSLEDEKYLLQKFLQEAQFIRKNLMGSLSARQINFLNLFIKKFERRLNYLVNHENLPLENVTIIDKTPSSTLAFGHQPPFIIPDKPFFKSTQANESYEREINNVLEILKSGDLDCLQYYFYPPSSCKIDRNGALLLEILRIAKSGDIDKRNDLKLRLALWRQQTSDSSQASMIDLLILILLSPEKFPESIVFFMNSKAQLVEFLRKIDVGRYKALVHNFGTGYSDFNFNAKVLPKLFEFSRRSQSITETAKRHKQFARSMESFFDRKEKSIEQFGEFPNPIEIQFDSNEERWQKLADWKKEYLNPISTTQQTNIPLHTDINALPLSSHEKHYKDPLLNDLTALNIDYELGKEQIKHSCLVSMTKNDCVALINQAQQVFTSVDTVVQEKRSRLIKLANTMPQNEREHLVEVLKIQSTVQEPILYKDCIVALLSLDFRHYQLLNPHLSKEDAVELAHLTLEVADLKSYKEQLERIISLANKIQMIDSSEDLIRFHLCQKLASEIEARYAFEGLEPEIEVALRVFSAETSIIPFKKQIDVIKQMLELDQQDPTRFKDIVTQLIMGGGKTSVLATILLYLSAKRTDRLALFLVPAPLYETVCDNLSESIQRAFKSQVLSIDVSRKDLTDYKLQQILDTLAKAKHAHLPLVMKAATLQSIELEFLSEMRALKKLHEAYKRLNEKSLSADRESLISEKRSLKQRVQILGQIVSEFKERADAIIDEEDLVLAPNSEVIFPFGEKIALPEQENLVLQYIFKALVNPKLKVSTLPDSPSIDQVVGLQKNQQANMNTDDFKKHVVPAIVEELITNCPSIQKAVFEFEDACSRYLSGHTPNHLQRFVDDPQLELDHLKSTEKNDVLFLRHLHTLSQSLNPKEKQSADLLSATKYYLQELLPATLKKTGNRDYGPPGDERSVNKMVPYDAVATPAITEFANHREQACYQYQYAAAFPLSEKQILEVAKNMQAMAEYFMERNTESFEETAEYLQFKEMFGIPLDKLNEDENLKKALAFANSNINAKLMIEFENVSKEATLDNQNLKSDAMSLCSQLASRQTMSGTTWNAPGLTRSLAERHLKDQGTEGKILYTLLKTAHEGKIHEDQLNRIEDFISSVLASHKTPKRIRGIIEAGGLFVKFGSNADVAYALSKALLKEKKNHHVDNEIEGVLFFHKDPGQEKADTLYVWKLGSRAPERIGGSSFEALLAKGLKPKNYFVYYDERHTTGTDILQTPDAINLMTFDKGMIQRTLCQSSMRLRQLLSSQKVEFVLTPEVRQTLVNQGQTVEDLILSAAKSQSIKKTEAMLRYFTQQINNIFRSHAVKKLLEVSRSGQHDQLALLVEQLEPFYITTIEDVPYQLFGRLSQKIDAKKMMLSYLNEKNELFKGRVSDHQLLDAVAKDVGEMKTYIHQTQALPKETESSYLITGTEQEVAVQQQVQQEQQEMQLEMQLEKELELELNKYLSIGFSPARKERPLTFEQFLDLVQKLKSKEKTDELISLQSYLKDYPYAANGERIPYENCFVESIYGTFNYFYPQARGASLPVFHQAFRPPKQILAVRVENQMHWMLFSEHEAQAVKEHLHRLFQEKNPIVDDLWLIHPDGTIIEENLEHGIFPIDEEIALRGLLEINTLAGHVNYLSKLPADLLQDWITTEKALKIRFLKLRVHRNEKQKRLFYTTMPLLDEDSYDQTKGLNGGFCICQKRIEREQSRQGTLSIDDPQEAAKFPPNRVKNLKTEHVKYLKTKEQLENIRPFQGRFIVPEQIPFLPPSKIRLLEMPEQIKKDGKCLLNADQVKALTPTQKHFIPHLNQEHYSLLSEKWQIEAIPVEHVKEIDSSKWHYLKNTQFQGLTDKQLKENNLEQLNMAPKYRWIHGNLIRNIPPKFLDFVTQKHIREISDLSLISQLEEIALNEPEKRIAHGTWTNMISPKMVPHIDFEKQLPLLQTKELIQAVPSEHVPKLNRHQVLLISENQAPHLKGAEQIQHCPDNLLCYINPEQVRHVPNSKIPFLRGEAQIHNLNPDQIKYLSAADKGDQINQIPLLAKKQIPHITEHQIQGLSLDQLSYLEEVIGKEKVKEFFVHLTREQVSQLNSAHLINFLTKEQIQKHVTAQQVPLLSFDWQIQLLLDQERINSLTHTQVPRIADNQVPHLTDQQVPHISREHVPHLTDQQVQHILEKHVPQLTDKQVQYISDKHVPSLTDKQVQYISDKHVPSLTDNQLQYILDKHVSYLTKEQVPHILEKHVPDLADKQVQYISDKHVHHLTDKQVEDLDFNTHPSEPEHPLFRRITQKQLDALNPERLSYLASETLKRITNPELIQKIPYGRVKHLTKEQLRHRSWGQFLVYTIGVITLGLVSSIIALIAYLTIIPVTYLCSKARGQQIRAIIDEHPWRLYHLFEVYAY